MCLVRVQRAISLQIPSCLSERIAYVGVGRMAENGEVQYAVSMRARENDSELRNFVPPSLLASSEPQSEDAAAAASHRRVADMCIVACR